MIRPLTEATAYKPPVLTQPKPTISSGTPGVVNMGDTLTNTDRAPTSGIAGAMTTMLPGLKPPTPTSPVPGTGSTMTTQNLQPSGFTDLRTQTIGAPTTGGNVSAPTAQPKIAAQDPSQAYQGLTQAGAQSWSPEASQLRGMAMTGLQGLSTAPNRADLASQAFQLMNERSAPQFAQDMRSVGQMASAFGRTGAGMTTNELTDLALARSKNQQQQASRMALEAEGMEMGDRLGVFDRTAGYGGQVAGEDMSRGRFGQDLTNNRFDIGSIVRGQNVGERDYASDEGWRRTDLGLNQQSRNDRNAWAGKDLAMQQQGRQDQQGQQAVENARQMQILQEMLMEGDYNRQYRTAELAGREGYNNDPYSLQLSGSRDASQQAGGQAQALAEAERAAAMQKIMMQYGGKAA
jgi:hypothetical protein